MIRRGVDLGLVEVKPGDIADDGDGRRVDLGFRHVFGCLLELSLIHISEPTRPY